MKKIIKNIISLTNLPINGSWQIVEEKKANKIEKILLELYLQLLFTTIGQRLC